MTHGFRDWIAEATDGRLQIEIVEPGALFTPADSLSAVGVGVADMAHASPGNWGGEMPEMYVLGGMPGAWDTLPMMHDAIYTYGLYDKTKALYDEYNVTYIPVPQLEIMNIMANFSMPDMNSVKGKKVRHFGQWSEYIKILGGSPVAIPYADVYTALKLGTVDGAFSGAQALEDVKWGEVVTDMVINPNALTTVFLFNNDSLEALPDDIRAIIESGTKYQLAWASMQLIQHQLYTVARADEIYGVKTWTWSPEDIATIRTLARTEVWPAFAEKSPLCAELVAQVEQQFLDYGLLK
jgi:TRAP-type C4-dicarboxylate transport system substrate-binding protein